jgi:hypothetical protein
MAITLLPLLPGPPLHLSSRALVAILPTPRLLISPIPMTPLGPLTRSIKLLIPSTLGSSKLVDIGHTTLQELAPSCVTR